MRFFLEKIVRFVFYRWPLNPIRAEAGQICPFLHLWLILFHLFLAYLIIINKTKYTYHENKVHSQNQKRQNFWLIWFTQPKICLNFTLKIWLLDVRPNRVNPQKHINIIHGHLWFTTLNFSTTSTKILPLSLPNFNTCKYEFSLI